MAFLPYSANTALAQSTSSGTVTGTVTDATGAVVPGATVTVTDIASKTKRTTTSNADGLYVLPNVPPGAYDVTATKTGFSMDEIPALTVAVGTQTNANFKMAVGAESTTVTVQASNTDLQTMNATTAETVDPAVVEALPAINRDASQFSSFQPGVTPGGNVAGTVQDQAVFDLDGGNNSSDMDGSMLSYTGSLGNSTTGGFLGASSSGVLPMPQDSVEEVRVATSGQTADFNNSSGMLSSIVTKRGRDRWTGTAYEYYLDSNIGANTWQNNFPNDKPFSTGTGSSTVFGTPGIGLTGNTIYTPKPSYHFSRFGVAAGGPIAPTLLGGKTYLFVNYEGFRYPLAATFERTIPSPAFLAGSLNLNGTTYTAAQLTAADPRKIGQSQALLAFYNATLPVGAAFTGNFDTSCGALSTSYCDSLNTIGYKANIQTPQHSNFFATRVDHDFGAKWHLMLSYRYYKFINQTSNQVDIGGQFAGDKLGNPTAVAPRPQQPWYGVVGLTTNISSTLTNDFHYSYLRNFWQWKDNNALQSTNVAGAGGYVEPLGETGSVTGTLVPYNINAQSTRTRIWDGQDNFFRDDITKLKGDHLIQAGGQYQHNYNYHQRTDNGNSINYTTTYQIGDASGLGNIALTNAGGLAGTVASNPNTLGANLTGSSTFERVAAAYYGFVTDAQVANTYTNNNGVLSLNAPDTSFADHIRVPYYNIYATDTWHLKPSLTVNYGLSYAIEMPPTDPNGNQVMFTDEYGNAEQVSQFLNNRKAQALAGNVYGPGSSATNGINPLVGFALAHNVNNAPGGGKYPYNPFYSAFSPRLSAAWSPKFKSPGISKIFGDSATVIRMGYGRIYGRINGDIQALNPILSPGLVLATQCRYGQSATTGTGACTNNGAAYSDTSAYRFGADGSTAPLAAAPANLKTPVYHPGFDGPGVAIASPVDPTFRPNDVDTFNFSIQRQLNRKMLVEVGYIGRLIHNELETLNPNAVPYQLTLGNQSFASAYLAIEGAFGCTTSASLCAKSATPTVTQQPFFEAALGGTGSAYCGAISCTQAVVNKLATNFRKQQIYTIWTALDNNTNGTTVPGFTFNRTLMGTPTSNTTYGSAGQLVTGLSVATSTGYGNYNGGYLSFKVTDYHGLTLQENMTYSKALGLNDSAQSASGTIADDSFNLRQSYGVEGYNQRIIFNTFLVYQDPYYKQQNGIIGRIAGGWTVAPVLTAGTGQPLACGVNSNGQGFGGVDGSNFTDNENCVFQTGFTGGYHTHRNVYGGVDSLGVSVGNSVHPGAPNAAVNIFNNPIAVFDSTRPAILGLDYHNGGDGPINGLPYLNLDLSIKKKLVVYNKYALELSAISTNVMNHLDFANPSLSLASTSSFGVTKTQGNLPRQIQLGARVYF